MLLPVAATFILCVWIILWSIGVKAIDGFLLVLLVMVVATGVKVLLRHLPSPGE